MRRRAGLQVSSGGSLELSEFIEIRGLLQSMPRLVMSSLAETIDNKTYDVTMINLFLQFSQELFIHFYLHIFQLDG